MHTNYVHRKAKGVRRHSTGSISKPVSETENFQPDQRVATPQDEGSCNSNPLHRLHSPNPYPGSQSPNLHNREHASNQHPQAQSRALTPNSPFSPRTSTNLSHQEMVSMLNSMDAQLQSAQVTPISSYNFKHFQRFLHSTPIKLHFPQE